MAKEIIHAFRGGKEIPHAATTESVFDENGNPIDKDFQRIKQDNQLVVTSLGLKEITLSGTINDYRLNADGAMVKLNLDDYGSCRYLLDPSYKTVKVATTLDNKYIALWCIRDAGLNKLAFGDNTQSSKSDIIDLSLYPTASSIDVSYKVGDGDKSAIAIVTTDNFIDSSKKIQQQVLEDIEGIKTSIMFDQLLPIVMVRQKYDNAQLPADGREMSYSENYNASTYDISNIHSVVHVTTPLKGNKYVSIWRLEKNGVFVARSSESTASKNEDTINLSEYNADTLYVFGAADNMDTTATISKNKLDLIGNVVPVANCGIVVADKLYAAVGDTLQLFFTSIFNCPDDYEKIVLCKKGKSFPRYFEYTPTEKDIGETDLTFEIRFTEDMRNAESTILARKTVKLVTIQPKDLSKKINILPAGDSTTEQGQWVCETARRIISNGGIPVGLNFKNFNFVGRHKKDIDGKSIGWEGTGGWSWDEYCDSPRTAYRFVVTDAKNVELLSVCTDNNGTRYLVAEINVTEGVGNLRCLIYFDNKVSPNPPSTGVLKNDDDTISINYTSVTKESYSPFIVDGKLTFLPYADKYCGGQIDVLLFLLGINGILSFSGDDIFEKIHNSFITRIEKICRKFHEEFPSSKIVISTIPIPSPNGGLGSNYNATNLVNYKAQKRKIFALNQSYIEFASLPEFASYVEISDVSAQVDTEHAYPYILKGYNTRCNDKEIIGTNAVHFSGVTGYMMVADAQFRLLLKC